MSEQAEVRKIKKTLIERGWLMEADAHLPSVVTLIVGKPVKGSWWGHAKGNLIYNTCGLLDEEKDVLCLKLINGKRTYVHRQYWDLLFALIHLNRGEILRSILSESSKLLKSVEKKGSFSSDQVKDYSKYKLFIKELEKHLLCYSHSIHTESGFHVTELVSWESLFALRKFVPKKLTSTKIELLTNQFKSEFSKSIHFPWD